MRLPRILSIAAILPLFIGCPGTVENNPGPPPPPPPTDPVALVVEAGASQTTNAGQTVNLTVTTTRGTPPFSFQWLQTAAGSSGSSTVNNASGQTASVTFSSDAGGTFTYQVTVTDAAGEQASDTVSVNVTANPPPVCINNSECDDGQFCNGLETCVAGDCQNGTTPCAPGEFCNESADRCDVCLDNSECDDGQFCNGLETCVAGDCQNGTAPCAPGEFCDESADSCDVCVLDADCDDGLFCNGQETCVAGDCQNGTAPCDQDEVCDETADQCEYAAKIYWTDVVAGEIWRANLDGTNPERFIRFLDEPTDVDFDSSRGALYWIERGSNEILYQQPPGSGTGQIATGSGSDWSWLAIDTNHSRICWTRNDGTGVDENIMCVDTDGTNMAVYVSGPGHPWGLAFYSLDVCGGYLYWADGGEIERACIDCLPGTSGGCANSLLSGLAGQPLSIAIDPKTGSMFWTNPSTHKIWRANLAGQNAVECYNFGVSTPVDIEVDSANGYIYWTDQGSQSIKRGRVDCTGTPETVVNTGSGTIFGIALDLGN